jgi:hypothetical protein
MQSVLIIPQLYSRFRLIPRRERHSELTKVPCTRKWADPATDQYVRAVEENTDHADRKKGKKNRRNFEAMKAVQAEPTD